MAAIDVFPQHFYGQLENVDIPNPQLATAIDDDDLEINLNTPITYSDGVTVVAIPFTIVIRNATTNYPETIHVQAGELSVDGTKITLSGLTQRGINPSQDSSGDVDYLSGAAARRSDHPQGSEVRISIHALDFKSMQKALQGEIASGGATWKIGRDIDEDITIYAYNGDLNLPYWGYDSATNQWIFSDDGVSSTPFGTGAGVTGGDGITVTAGDIDIDVTDTTIFVKTSSGAGDENKAAILDASGKFALGFIENTLQNLITDVGTTTGAELAQLAGINATVDAAALNVVTGGSSSNADGEHTHPALDVLDANGHIVTSGSTPSTDVGSVVGNDNAGVITGGNQVTVSLTYANAYSSTPVVVVTGGGVNSQDLTITASSTTGFTITSTANLNFEVIQYIVLGK